MSKLRILKSTGWSEWMPYSEYEVEKYALVVFSDESHARVFPLMNVQEFEIEAVEPNGHLD